MIGSVLASNFKSTPYLIIYPSLKYNNIFFRSEISLSSDLELCYLIWIINFARLFSISWCLMRITHTIHVTSSAMTAILSQNKQKKGEFPKLTRFFNSSNDLRYSCYRDLLEIIYKFGNPRSHSQFISVQNLIMIESNDGRMYAIILFLN